MAGGRINTFACNVCDALKRDVNRWFVLYELDGELKVREWDESTPFLWEKLEDLDRPRAAACGEGHALALTERWLGSRSFLAPSQRPVGPSAPSAKSADSPSPAPAPLPQEET